MPKVIDLLKTKDDWCKFSLAQDKDGDAVMALSPEAVRFCLVGAIWRCYPDHSEAAETVRILIYGENCVLSDSIGTWNDAKERTFEEVRAIIEKANI